MCNDTYLSKAPQDETCLALAFLFAQLRSKDPNTKVGACVYDPKTGGMFLGYNGFPAGVPDLKVRWDCRDVLNDNCKYHYVVHAETNAVRKAMMALGRLDGCTLFVTHFPCRSCIKDAIISSGLKKVVYWHDSHFDAVASKAAMEAGIELTPFGNAETRLSALLNFAIARIQ